MPCEVLHDSRRLRYRNPQGAVPAGVQIRLAVYARGRWEQAQATLRLWIAGEERLVPMQKAQGGGAWFSAMAQMPDSPQLAWYYFILRLPEGETICYGGESGEGQLLPHEPTGYQITVYDPAFTTPRWLREGLMYQIFPDRFRRGGGVPFPGVGEAADAGVRYHREKGRPIRTHTRWEEQPDYQPDEGQPHYQPNDFFGGNLSGIREKLPYLKELGVSCIYLNPIFESGSNHRYDTADYRRVDPILGSEEELAALAKAAHAAGIRLMLDGVFSHTGADSTYFNKYGRYDTPGAYRNTDSPYRSWYQFGGGYQFGYRTWWGFPELPEVDESDEGYQHFIMGAGDSLLAHWGRLGATSWRLDVADELPDWFIQKLRARLKQIDPEGALLGEVWEDASNKEAYGERRKYVLGGELDSVMNYPFSRAVLAFLRYEQDAYALNHALQTLREHYPKPFYYAAMNMLSTHDSVRALTALSGAPHRDTLSRAEQAAYAPAPAALALGKQRLLCATAVQMALPGIPSIYYGDEAGLQGMADPFNRGTYPWGREDTALQEAVAALARARAGSPALRAGYCRMGALGEDVFAALRYTAGGRDAFGEDALEDAALLLVNRAGEGRRVLLGAEDLDEGPDAAIPVRLEGCWQDVRTGENLHCDGPVLTLVLPPMAAMLLRRQENTIA